MSKYANEKIKEYANEMPYELRRAMGALDDDIRLAVFFVLLKYGELPFSQIMKKLEIPSEYSSKLTYHIKKLQKGAIVKNEYVKKEGVDSYSFYDITEFGEGILNNLMNTIILPTASISSFSASNTSSTSSLTKITSKSESTLQSEIVLGNITTVSNKILLKYQQNQQLNNLISIATT